MEIGRLVAGMEPGDRRLLLGWGAGAGLAVAVWAVASAMAAVPEIDPLTVASVPDSASVGEIGQSDAAKLEARNAQLLRAIVTLSDDNDALQNRIAELEKRVQTVAEVPALANRMSRMEGEVAHIASTMPFARTTTTTTVTAALTDPAPLTPMPAPMQPPAVRNAVAALPAPAHPEAAAPPPKLADTTPPPAAPAEAIAAPPPATPLLDPVETAAIDPDAQIEMIGEGDAMDPSELAEMQIAMAEPSSAGASQSSTAQPVRVPIPTPRPAQVATRTVFGVNLGRFESVAKVKSSWKAMTQKDPALVKPLKPMIAMRDGDEGRETYLVAGPFADAGAAAVACAKFKAIGATCRTTNYNAD